MAAGGWAETQTEQGARGGRELRRRAPAEASSQGVFLSLDFVLNMVGSHWGVTGGRGETGTNQG